MEKITLTQSQFDEIRSLLIEKKMTSAQEILKEKGLEMKQLISAMHQILKGNRDFFLIEAKETKEPVETLSELVDFEVRLGRSFTVQGPRVHPQTLVDLIHKKDGKRWQTVSAKTYSKLLAGEPINIQLWSSYNVLVLLASGR